MDIINNCQHINFAVELPSVFWGDKLVSRFEKTFAECRNSFNWVNFTVSVRQLAFIC